MRIYLLCFFILSLCTCVCAQSEAPQKTRWEIQENGKSIVWRISEDDNLPHGDNIEMSGRGVSMVVDYQIDSNRMVKVQRRLIYPQMRPFIKDTDPAWWATYRNYLRRHYEDAEVMPTLYVNGLQQSPGPIDSITIDGILTLYHGANEAGLRLKRQFFPSPEGHLAYEMHGIQNITDDTLTIQSGEKRIAETLRGAEGAFDLDLLGGVTGQFKVAPQRYFNYQISFDADRTFDRLHRRPEFSGPQSFFKRQKMLSILQENLVLETPEPIYNTMFSLAKIRGAESIFDSKLGLVHSPGGERYYIGFWANDQAEYINPFFPYLGYDLGNDAALNMWRVYAKAIPKDGSNIRYAFEMEGDSPANPLDRGDAAMIAYGLSHYLLALGDEDIARELWPLLEWCLDFNHRKLNEQGVVASASDEMEGRIETGDANLSTSSLYYGALETSISLGQELKVRKKLLRAYQKRREALALAIESFFGREVEGLDTYRYFEGHEALRHWICLPLVVGLHDRAPGTLEGLFDRLWTDNGVAVEKNHPNPAISKIFWDRGTLYALRGAFIADGTKQAHERLLQFSRERLLGERVPYVVEAYPEGGMAHLSAENGLYCRIFTEGIFGMLPTGFRSFRIQPRMPAGWDEMALRNIHAFGQNEGFDLEVSRVEGEITVTVVNGSGEETKYTFPEGEAFEIQL